VKICEIKGSSQEVSLPGLNFKNRNRKEMEYGNENNLQKMPDVGYNANMHIIFYGMVLLGNIITHCFETL